MGFNRVLVQRIGNRQAYSLILEVDLEPLLKDLDRLACSRVVQLSPRLLVTLADSTPSHLDR